MRQLNTNNPERIAKCYFHDGHAKTMAPERLMFIAKSIYHLVSPEQQNLIKKYYYEQGVTFNPASPKSQKRTAGTQETKRRKVPAAFQ
jgi:hypothetical protein